MNEEQLLQEARIEAEKFYPFKSDWSSHNDTIDFNQDRRLAYVQGYIANAKKQMSEAVELNDIIKCIVDFDKSETSEIKGRYFDVIQRDLEKLYLSASQNQQNENPIDWNQLRDEFFDECTDNIYCNDGNNKLVVNIAPHDLFNWFKNKIENNK